MKGFTVTAILLALTATAVAKPVPVKNLNPMEDLNPAFARVDVDINSGPAGAMLEREYFEAHRPPMNGGMPCRFQSAIFDKVRLAQLCR
ncbi:MAG TPA: hypothetical protein VIY07_09515 [Pseudolabrys sp.]